MLALTCRGCSTDPLLFHRKCSALLWEEGGSHHAQRSKRWREHLETFWVSPSSYSVLPIARSLNFPCRSFAFLPPLLDMLTRFLPFATRTILTIPALSLRLITVLSIAWPSPLWRLPSQHSAHAQHVTTKENAPCSQLLGGDEFQTQASLHPEHLLTPALAASVSTDRKIRKPRDDSSPVQYEVLYGNWQSEDIMNNQ